MGKRKSGARVVKKQRIKLDDVFDCPFCNNDKCVEVTLKKAAKKGIVYCRVCEEKFQYPINDLMKATHVYGMFIEDCENANKN